MKNPTIETEAGPQRAAVLAPIRPSATLAAGALRLQEACGLAEALGLEVRLSEITTARKPSPGLYLGGGKVEALATAVAEEGLDVVIIDAALTPVQQRNLERALHAKVIDRTGLILEIFGRRAATKEGRLQVELARLAYERSRLVRTWTHLERQRGGLGKTGGPGESQIELDRRQIADRMVRLKAELEQVRRTRGLARRARVRAGLPSVALVGYTNAGKSTLFNRLTSAGVLAKDMPFATLDPTARLIRLPTGRNVVLSDTVGFIADLPTELIAAFRATLEAVLEADVLIHVRDSAHPNTQEQREDVLAVLQQVEQQGGRPLPPIIEAWNKLDLLPQEEAHARALRAEAEDAFPISAITGQGVPALLAAIDRKAYGVPHRVPFALDPADGAARARIAAAGRIVEERMDDDGRLHIVAELPIAEAARLGALAPQTS